MKKLLLSFFVVLAALCGVLAFTACEKDPAPNLEHVHSWSAWTSDGKGNHTRVCELDASHTETEKCDESLTSVVTDPTCEDDGYTTHTCTKCEYSFRDTTVEKLGHDYAYTFDKETKTHTAVCKRNEEHVLTSTACSFDEGLVTLSPTCTTDGERTFTCEYCQGSYKETVDKLEHDWRYTFDEETHSHSAVCNNDPTHKIDPTPCDMTDGLETAPTCTTNGFTSYICKVCFGKFDTYDEATQKATGHSYPDTWEPMEGEKHFHICENPDCGQREEVACSFSEQVVTDPTCLDRGFTTKTCPDCKATKIEDWKDALDHSFEDAEYVSNHNGTHYRVCTRQGCDERDEEACSDFTTTQKKATCTENGTETKKCNDCHYETVTETETATGHEFENYKYVFKDGKHMHTATCSNPDCEETSTDNCIFSEEKIVTAATCMKDGSEKDVCPICQHEEIKVLPALGHSFEGATYVSLQNGRHYVECTRKCGEEGARQESQCTMVEGSKIPNSCTQAGSTADKRCSSCGYTEKGTVIPANGHTWKNNPQNDGWTFTADGKHKRECSVCTFSEERNCQYTEQLTDPKCDQDGERVKTCTLCKNVVKETIGRLGHDIETYTFESHTGSDGVEYHYHKGYCKRCTQDVREACQLQEMSTTPATCTESGTRTVNCIRCGHVHKYITEEAKGHTSSGDYKFDAEKHQHYSTCISCGVQIDPTDCTPDPKKTTVQKPTCNLNGYTLQTCSECGNTWREQEVPSYQGHDWVVSAGSYLKQYNQHAVHCSRCPASMYVPCTYQIETVDVTCEADGYTRQYCTACGGEYSKTVTPTSGHVYHYEYTGDGQDKNTHRVTCDNCDLNREDDCTLKPVTSVATCTKAGDNDLYCTVCENVLTREDTPALGHIFEYKYLYNDTHLRTCTRCRFSETVKCQIGYETQTGNCVTPTKRIATCRDCQNSTTKTIANPLGHQWEKWSVQENGEHVRNCLLCETQETRSGHDFSESNFCDCGFDGLLYEDAGDGFRVIRNPELKDTERIVIPATHGGKNVIGIGSRAFCDFALTEIVIPDTVKTIADYALNYCIRLQTVTFGNVGTDNKTIDTEVTSQLTSIGEYALQGNRELVTFDLPETLTSIGAYAFDKCANYDDFTVPEGADEIGKGAFNGTKHVNDAKLEGDALYLGKHLIRVTESHKGAFEIKKGTLSVAEGAFENCTGLTDLTIYAGILRFDKDAFKGCTGLSSVVFQKEREDQSSDELLKAWFKIAFENDDASPLNYTHSFHIVDLQGDIKIPEDATYIPVGTFRGDDIKTVEIPDTVTHIGAAAFFGCTSLTSVTIPDTVISIGAYAFYGCTELETITFKSVTSETQRKESYFIGENAFTGTKYYKTASHWDEHGILYIGKHLIKANSGKAAVVDTIAAVPDLAQMAAIPEEVAITTGEIAIKDDTITISSRAFQGCDQVEKVTIGEKVEFIGQQAFSGCSKLSKAIIKGKANFLAWSFYPGTTNHYIGRSVNPNPNGDEKSQSDMAHWLTAGYPGEWSRLVTA